MWKYIFDLFLELLVFEMQVKKVTFHDKLDLFVLAMALSYQLFVCHTVRVPKNSCKNTTFIIWCAIWFWNNKYPQTGSLKKRIALLVFEDHLLNILQLIFITKNIDSSQLRHLLIVTIKIVLSELNLHFLYNKLAVVKFLADFLD